MLQFWCHGLEIPIVLERGAQAPYQRAFLRKGNYFPSQSFGETHLI